MKKEFSEYDVEEMNVKGDSDEEYTETGCIGISEETLDIKNIKKKCKGRVIKNKARHAGSGKLKVTGHILYDAYNKIYGLNNPGLKDGVKSFGSGELPNLTITQKVRDEDCIIKLKAYPNAVVSSASARKIDGSAEDIAEVEIEFDLSCDENGQVMYEMIIEDEDSSENKALITSWMTNFSADLVTK